MNGSIAMTRARWHGRLAVAPLLVLPATVLAAWPRSLPAWGQMWTLAAAIFSGCKWLTWVTADRAGVPAWRNMAYLAGWPGLNAEEFLQSPPVPASARPTSREWLAAAAKLAFGVSLLWGGIRFVPEQRELLRGWLGMMGIAFVLHFGGFHVLSCVWRSAGVRAERLMDFPLATTGVSEFWGRRWNRAFRDLTHRFVFRPLTAQFGPKTALLTGFLLSGLVHDLVISVPARGGYGGPTAYFLIQAAAILVERSRPGRRAGLGHGIRGWAFAALVLLLPAPWLFHEPFVSRVIIPFLQAVGAT